MNSVKASGSLAQDKNAEAPTISSTSGIRFSSLTFFLLTNDRFGSYLDG